MLLDGVKNKKALIVFSVCLLIKTIISNVSTLQDSDLSGNWHNIYRVDSELIEVLESIDGDAKNSKNTIVFSTDLRANLLTDSLTYIYDVENWRAIYYYSGEASKNPQLDYLYSFLDKSEKMENVDWSIIPTILEVQNIHYVLIDQKQVHEVYNELEKACTVMKQNSKYIGYQCNNW